MSHTTALSVIQQACLGSHQHGGLRPYPSPLDKVEAILAELAQGGDVRCTAEARAAAATGLEMIRRIENVLRAVPGAVAQVE